MSRSAYAIANTGLEDLHQVQAAFIELQAMFTVMLRHFPQDSTAHDFALLGMARTDAWSEMVSQWSECMDNELDDLEGEQEAYQAKMQRMRIMRDAEHG